MFCAPIALPMHDTKQHNTQPRGGRQAAIQTEPLLYADDVLELYRSPLHHRVLSPADAQATQHNASCGDQVVVTVRFHPDSARGGEPNQAIVSELGWIGEGCVISMVGASLMTEWAVGRPTKCSKYCFLRCLKNFCT
jgi:hypothetical protein